MAWKPEYAEADKKLRGGTGPNAAPTWHHVNPYLPGRADCSGHVILDMGDVRISPPEQYYCSNCRRKQFLAETREAAAADEEG